MRRFLEVVASAAHGTRLQQMRRQPREPVSVEREISRVVSMRPLPDTCLVPLPQAQPAGHARAAAWESSSTSSVRTGSTAPLDEAIAHPANGLDRVVADVLSQAADEDVNQVRAGVEVVTPHMCEDLVA